MKQTHKKIVYSFLVILAIGSLFASFAYRNPLFAIVGFLAAFYVQKDGKDVLLKDYYDRIDRKQKELKSRRR